MKAISGLYEDWFLDYASYVILERAVPAIEDGLKPVQRRILHAMKEMDDGRFHKVANIIGSTMQYHPHGDASIGDALVNIGQKELLIETQGNWGDIRTGDRAAAPRYIEARLSKFALEVVFNGQTTEWQAAYDGRKNEPVTLPVKFPLGLAQGADGIAVGLATKIMPHNFCELILASIDLLRGKTVQLYPDFATGGMIDVSNYNDGKRGGKIRVRARLESPDGKRLLIKDIPYGTTTGGIMESIVKANDAGKIKIKKVTDNTAKDVEVEVVLAPGQSPDVTIDALYAFTDCEVSISPNLCAIIQEKPRFMTVTEWLTYSTDHTVGLLKRELEIRRDELMEKLLFSSLEKIFIENRIYRDIEECETWESVLDTIDLGLQPYKASFYREITRDDLIRLTEIKIKRISRFDAFKADELMRKYQEELDQVNHHLTNLTDYAVDYFQNLLKKYGKGRERKTEIREFDNIELTKVAANNAKLYVNRIEGFVGMSIKKDEFISDCSDIDDIIVFLRNGQFMVTKIADKTFVGKDILHVEVHHKTDERKVFNMAYLDGETGISRVKRFQVLSITRDKLYDLTRGTKGTKVLHFSSNPNGEAETLGFKLSPNSRSRNKSLEFDFADIEIKGRASQGNILTKYPILARTIKVVREGVSTLGAMKLWYDGAVGKLNTDGNGLSLGNFKPEDLLLALYQSGEYEVLPFDLMLRFEPKELISLTKLEEQTIVSAIYYDGIGQQYYVKRFQIETSRQSKRYLFISEHAKSKLIFATANQDPTVLLKPKEAGRALELHLPSQEAVKGWRAAGKKLSYTHIAEVKAKNNQEDEEQMGLF